MGVFQKIVDTFRRTVKKPPQPQSDINTVSYYQYFLPCQDEDTIQVEDLPRKRSPCVNLKTLEGWKDFQVKGNVLFTEDDFTSPEPSRVRHVTSETNQPERLHIRDDTISEPGELTLNSSSNHVHPTTKSFLWGFLQRHWQLRCIITGISLLQILNACHVVERKYSKQDLVAIYQAIGGYVFIHSKINILPMTFGMHIAWDGGLRDKGGKEGEREGKGGNSGRGGNDGQDGGPSELGDLPHEGMVTHCAVMEEVSSTFANDGSAHFDGVVVDHPRPISTASMTEAQSIAAVWRNPHNVLPNHPHPLRYYLPLWNRLGNGFAKPFLHWSVTSL
ncbi:uncharacterized protein C8R40DRAFT_1164351 [Lentinula edodes]|uniref:uncharacterized protein n=1 Tax=Lentinula edodes TaxID=5353 RepID=UPI001E8D65A7|nr:uncharacterized protein C8R40DRAFT_1164351 [Lentinula edodes]KAH7880919.1 hypothetical protein C8R40DRAFT_1164351 [Lentinula edodes]